MIRQFFQKRLVTPLLELLKQGTSPSKLALSVGLGLGFGIFPMIGTTTVLCLIFGFIFKVNQPAIQIINYFTYPLQLLFFIPFFQLGAWIFQAEPITFSVTEVISMLTLDPWPTIRLLWWANLRAVVAWCLIGPILTWTSTKILTPVFSRIAPPQSAP